MEDLSGQTLGAYKLLNRIGMGGMATVYRAYQASMDRYVAIKVLPREFAEDPTFVGRFQQEAHTIAKLEHRHILPVYDYGEHGGVTYLVMRYIEAGTLKGVVEDGPVEISTAVRLAVQIADALEYAHRQGVTHRDVKPSNVLIDQSGDAFLTDFGIAKLAESLARFTGTGQLIGTPSYMSPEQGQGIPADQRADIYSLGVVLYEMVTGRLPFEAETPVAVVLMHLNDPLPPPRKINPAIPDAVERVILKATAKDPDERYPTAGEMSRALQDALADMPTVRAEAVPPESAAPTVAQTVTVEGAQVPAGRGLSVRLVLAAVAVVVALVAAIILIAGSGGLSDADATATADVQTQVAQADLTAQAPTATDTDTPTATQTPEPTAGPFTFAAPARWDHFTSTARINNLIAHEGYIWAATDGGLARWSPDGSYVKYNTAEGLPFSGLRALLFDLDGGLWLGGGYRSGLLRVAFDADGQIANVEDFSDMDGDSHYVWAFLQTEDALYLGEYGPNIRVWDGQTWPVAMPPPEGLGEYIVEMAWIEGELWVGMGEGLVIWDGEAWRQVEVPTRGEIELIYQDGTGAVWVSAEGYVLRYSPEEDTWEDLTDWAGDYGLEAALQASDGSLWLGGDGFLARRDPDTDAWQMFDDVSGWERDPIVEDAEGGIWVTVDRGILRYDGVHWAYHSASGEPSDNDFNQMLLTDDGELWFVVRYGGTILSYDPAANAWSTAVELDLEIRAVALDGDVIWVGTREGLVRLEGGAQRRFLVEDGLIHDEINALLVDPQNPDALWIGTEAGISRFDTAAETWESFVSEDTGLASDNVTQFYADPDGRIWAASARGDEDPDSVLASLSVFDRAEGTWTLVGEGGAPFHQYADWIRAIITDAEGNLWVSPSDGGLYRWDGERWREFTDADGAPASTVLAMLNAPDGSLWFSTSEQGFFRFDARQGWSHISQAQLGWRADVRQMLIGPGGDDLWLLTEEDGVIRFRP